MFHTDQSPRFGTHVIRGLTDKFNHHRVKDVYHLNMFRDRRSVFCAQPLPHTLKRARRERERECERERERERYDSDTAFQTMPQQMDTFTYTIPILASIWVNTVVTY